MADTLSRACQQSHSNIAADDLSSIMNVDIIGILPISKEKVQQLQLETQADKKLQELNKCIKEEWPMDESKSKKTRKET